MQTHPSKHHHSSVSDVLGLHAGLSSTATLFTMPSSTPHTNQSLSYCAHAAAISGKLCTSYLLLSPAKTLVQDSTACLRIGLLRGLAIVVIAMYLSTIQHSGTVLVASCPGISLTLSRNISTWSPAMAARARQVHGEKEKKRKEIPCLRRWLRT